MHNENDGFRIFSPNCGAPPYHTAEERETERIQETGGRVESTHTSREGSTSQRKADLHR